MSKINVKQFRDVLIALNTLEGLSKQLYNVGIQERRMEYIFHYMPSIREAVETLKNNCINVAQDDFLEASEEYQVGSKVANKGETLVILEIEKLKEVLLSIITLSVQDQEDASSLEQDVFIEVAQEHVDILTKIQAVIDQNVEMNKVFIEKLKQAKNKDKAFSEQEKQEDIPFEESKVTEFVKNSYNIAVEIRSLVDDIKDSIAGDAFYEPENVSILSKTFYKIEEDYFSPFCSSLTENDMIELLESEKINSIQEFLREPRYYKLEAHVIGSLAEQSLFFIEQREASISKVLFHCESIKNNLEEMSVAFPKNLQQVSLGKAYTALMPLPVAEAGGLTIIKDEEQPNLRL